MGSLLPDRAGLKYRFHYVGWSLNSLQSVCSVVMLVVQSQVCCSEGLLPFCHLCECGMVQVLEVVLLGTHLGLSQALSDPYCFALKRKS